MPKYQEPRLCEFTEIKLKIPRYRLIKLLFKKGFLTFDEMIFLRSFVLKTEIVENQLLHTRSIAEKALLKSEK